MAEITALLERIHSGDTEALTSLLPLVYRELKKLASAHLRRERDGVPLQTTELVHEAFLRLSGSRQPSYENRSHFYGIASRLMRQVLVDMARARSRVKRAGVEVRLTGAPEPEQNPDQRLLLIDGALERLNQIDELKVQLIDMRYFSGMTAEESAEALSLSVHTVRRELRLAQAWLRKELAD
jgi:RNA polymerase sigma factor (TIGR02999 family)